MTKPVLLCSASMLALCVCNTAFAAKSVVPITHARGSVHRIVSAAPGSVTLYDQNNDESGVAVLSTNFTDFDSFDSFGADDFTVPVGHKWRIKEVGVAGVYGGSPAGPADSENVLFYKDKAGLPGEPITACNSLKGTDNQGSFAIKLPKSCKVNLKGGKKYWVSVVANVDFQCCGTWNWETRNTQNGRPAAWENPNGGFFSCRTWDVMTSCIGNYGEGPDFMFTLKGKDIAQ